MPGSGLGGRVSAQPRDCSFEQPGGHCQQGTAVLDSISNQVKKWRRLATECRTYAGQLQNAEDRASFARTAQKYEQAADKLARRAQRSPRLVHAKKESEARGLRMRYYLIHRFGQADPFEYSNQSFSTHNAATARACSLIGAGELGDFWIKDSEGRLVADDTTIKALCKAASKTASGADR